MPQFVSKIAPSFEWLAEGITMQEFEAALNLCNNTAPGEDG
jgi:hypothetical protein